MGAKKQKRKPSPLRKWVKDVESFEVKSCADGTHRIEPVYIDGVSRYGADWDEAEMQGRCSLGMFSRMGMADDIQRVLARALREAKR